MGDDHADLSKSHIRVVERLAASAARDALLPSRLDASCFPEVWRVGKPMMQAIKDGDTDAVAVLLQADEILDLDPKHGDEIRVETPDDTTTLYYAYMFWKESRTRAGQREETNVAAEIMRLLWSAGLRSAFTTEGYQQLLVTLMVKNPLKAQQLANALDLSDQDKRDAIHDYNVHRNTEYTTLDGFFNEKTANRMARLRHSQ